MLKSFVSVGTFGDRFTSMKVIRVENFHLKPIIITCLVFQLMRLSTLNPYLTFLTPPPEKKQKKRKKENIVRPIEPCRGLNQPKPRENNSTQNLWFKLTHIWLKEPLQHD